MAGYAEVAEGVKATIAAYCHALDDGRVDDVVALFCADGGADIPGMRGVVGHDALREAYARFVPQVPQRHLVLNTVVTPVGDDGATAVSDLVFMVKGEAGWAVQLVGRYDDVLHRDGDRWLFHHRAAAFQ